MTSVSAPDATLVELSVEAGASIETSFEVTTTAPVADLELHLRGLPESWYELSVRRLDLGAGHRARVLLVIHPPRLEHGGAPGIYDLAVEGVDADPSAWRLRVVPPGLENMRRGRLLEFLPRHFRTDPFLARFLLIFQATLEPIEQAIDNTHLLFEPGLTPAALLEWLATWLDLDLSSVPDEAGRRRLIERAIELYRWKGTRRGLRRELALRLSARALVVENFDGLRLGHDAALGINTYLGRRRDACVAITLGSRDGAEADILERAAEIIDAARPAGCGYVLRLAPPRADRREEVEHG
jgi:phage tail-like protein